MAFNSTRSIPDLFADVVTQFTMLLRKEGQLARTEVSENISRAAGGIGLMVGGAVLLIPALVILLQAGVTALMDYGLAPHWASLIVGGAALLIGLVLLLIGKSRLKPERLMPNRTFQQLQQDASMAKDQVRDNHGYDRAA